MGVIFALFSTLPGLKKGIQKPAQHAEFSTGSPFL